MGSGLPGGDRMEKRVAYICDGNIPECSKTGCAYIHEYGLCMNTCDEDHARNGACPDPENHPERFEYIQGVYFEREPLPYEEGR